MTSRSKTRVYRADTTRFPGTEIPSNHRRLAPHADRQLWQVVTCSQANARRNGEERPVEPMRCHISPTHTMTPWESGPRLSHSRRAAQPRPSESRTDFGNARRSDET